jgi:hypothetical protein
MERPIDRAGRKGLCYIGSEEMTAGNHPIGEICHSLGSMATVQNSVSEEDSNAVTRWHDHHEVSGPKPAIVRRLGTI